MQLFHIALLEFPARQEDANNATIPNSLLSDDQHDRSPQDSEDEHHPAPTAATATADEKDILIYDMWSQVQQANNASGTRYHS